MNCAFVRLLEIRLIEKEGVKEMALAFGRHSQALRLAEGKQTQGWSNNRRKIGQATWLQMDKQIAQLLASVPDRAGFKAASSLQSPYPFCCILFLIDSSGVLVSLSMLLTVATGPRSVSISHSFPFLYDWLTWFLDR